MLAFLVLYIILYYKYVYITGHNIIYYIEHVIVISCYEHDIQVITQDRGEVEVAGDDLDIMRVIRDITNFYSMQMIFN